MDNSVINSLEDDKGQTKRQFKDNLRTRRVPPLSSIGVIAQNPAFSSTKTLELITRNNNISTIYSLNVFFEG